MTLSLLLKVLLFPFVVAVLYGVFEELKSFKRQKSVKESSLLYLEVLIELISKSRTIENKEMMAYGITHFLKVDEEKYEVYFSDIKINEIDAAQFQKYLTNSFIRYKGRYWVNSYWIKKVSSKDIKLLNGIKLSVLA